MNPATLSLLLFILFIVLIIFGIPIGFSLGIIGIIGLIVMDQNFMMVAQTFLSGINHFAYLAIPFFVLLGIVMEKAKISGLLVDFADELVGYLAGGLAMGTTIASAIFAAISGSGPATVAAIGTVAIPEMVKKGYSKRFAVSVAASGGILGPIIPPSIPFIIYGVVVEESITKLFLGGMGAGLVLAFLMMVLSFTKAKIEKVPVSGRGPSLKGILRATWRAKVGLIAPAVVLGLIYGGVCTPTESGAIGSIYVILVGFFVTRTLTLKGLLDCMEKTARTSAMIMFVIGAAYLPAWLMASWNIPEVGTKFILELGHSKFIFLIFVNILFLIIGSLLDTPAAIVILAPILHPIAIKLGIDPTHFGTIVVVNFVIGYITPPFAYNLFVAKGITGMTMDELSLAVLPFLFVSLLGLVLITYIPEISLFFPRLFMG
ncbi:MAG: TRAP transporter large permease [Deltaproteobacteria bacterium]|nr:TRAP transporter large permease [Deltaproteobacteria bacterium]